MTKREGNDVAGGLRDPRGPTIVDEEALRVATERLVAQFRPERVILFGSQARGTADARSDVDLLVICAFDAKGASRRALMVAMDRALSGLGFARDVIVLTPEEFERDRQIPGTVARPAWREGIVLYEAP
jgi:predicted nucleotidyltransferase